MGKRFNTTGVCISRKHYMVDITAKIDKIEKLIEDEFYFVINRPRQYGKTTTLAQLYKKLKNKYIVIDISFEGFGIDNFKNSEIFCRTLLNLLKKQLKGHEDLLKLLVSVDNIADLAELICNLTENNEMVLIIDEVDKASNNRLLLDFLGMLRFLYLDREKELCTTFKSVILAGVHDIRNLKLKFRDDEEERYNSPWNIAVRFDIDMSFNKDEIASMLKQYSIENNLEINIKEISAEIFKFTSGYPFLVSRLCQIIDEELLSEEKVEWTISHIQKAVKLIIDEKNTLFDDLIKNMEHNQELYKCIYNILVMNTNQSFNINNPIIDLGHVFGYLIKDENSNIAVSNQILKEVIYNYMISKTDNRIMSRYNYKDNFITKDNTLDMQVVLLKFQKFMKENYNSRDIDFLERQGVLLFLSFIKPIINGVGFDYKEVQISEERRIDIVIQYNNQKYVIETKIWHGEVAHQKGLEQLCEYLNVQGLSNGYLLIFNFNKNKEYSNDVYKIENKEVFEVIV